MLLDDEYPDAEKVILICDNLNTHKTASLYEAFPPEEARRLVEGFEIHYTPKHGGWLNIAECELSVLSRQCLSRRTADFRALKRKVIPWAGDRNKRPSRRRLAIHDRRRPHQAQAALPTDSNVIGG